MEQTPTQIPTDNATPPGALTRVILAVLIALTLIPVTALATETAYAADIPNVGDSYSGSCYIEDTWRTGSVSYFNVGSFTGELSGCWAIGSWQCANPSAAAPTYVGATYTASVTAVNVTEGWVEYSVMITPPGATNGIDRDENGWLLGYQRVAGTARVAKEFGGYIELSKTTANASITSGNDCYSFAGGVFNVYNSDGKHMATLTTNSDGWAKTTDRLAFGWYNVKEITPPKGCALDESDHWVEITAANDATVKLTVADQPQSNMVDVAVYKLSADTTSNFPQGDTALTGAEFQIAYYDGYYSTEAAAMASGKPTRTWTLKTDAKGEARLTESYLVSGSDALYKNSQGKSVIPLGTVVVKEIKAPVDYVLPTPAPVEVVQITSNGKAENITTYNARKIVDVVKRGDIAITKFYDDSPDEDTGTMVPEKEIAFDFYGSHQYTGTNPKSDAKPAFSLTTDEFGRADTSKLYVIEQEDGTYKTRPRSADDAGALPHDTYLMVQRTSVDGYEKIKPMLIYVSEDGKTYDYLLQNGTIQTPLKVVKVDSETGEVVPYPASWQIISADTGKPVSMTTHYPITQTFDVFTSDEQGRLTLPEKLLWGDYELKEVEAPNDGSTGYLINPVNVKFSTSEGYDWDNPLTITFADAPAKGMIEIKKSDAMKGGPVESATYVIQTAEDIYTLDGTLRASEGEIVDTITTDEAGYAASKELYLGHYYVTEAISPEGFALDTTCYSAILEYEDQTVAVVTHTLEVSDKPTVLRIQKVDALSGEPMSGVSFLLTNEAKEFEQVLVTDEFGNAEIGYLPHGEYSLTEIDRPGGYTTNDEVCTFIVDDQGLIEGRDLYLIKIENTPIQVVISKTDIATSIELPGCGMEIYAVDEDGTIAEEPLHAWESTGDSHQTVGGLEPGNYLLVESYPAPGYVTAESIEFTVEDTGEIQQVFMEDDFTKTDISKRDITTDEELPGAILEVYAADENGNRTGEYLSQWMSSGEPYRIERLAPGSYILHESAAPAGFDLAQDVSFTVTETEDVETVMMYDAPTPDEPDTPGKGYDKTGFDPTLLVVLLVLLGAGAMLGLGIGIKRHHRHRQEKEKAGELTIPKGEDISGDDDLFKD